MRGPQSSSPIVFKLNFKLKITIVEFDPKYRYVIHTSIIYLSLFSLVNYIEISLSLYILKPFS